MHSKTTSDRTKLGMVATRQLQATCTLENVHQLGVLAPPHHAVSIEGLIDLGVAALGHEGGHVAADDRLGAHGDRRPRTELVAAAEAGDLEQRRVDLAHGVLAQRVRTAQLHLRLPPHALGARQLLLGQLRVPLRLSARLVRRRLLRHRLPELLPRLLLVRPRRTDERLAATIPRDADGQLQVRGGGVVAFRTDGRRARQPRIRRQARRGDGTTRAAAERRHELELKVMSATKVFRRRLRRGDLVEPVERGSRPARHCWWTGPSGRADDDVAGGAGARGGPRQ
jgi:hypothetical protein